MDESLTMAIRSWLLKPITDRLTEMEEKMANEAEVLNSVADKLNSDVFPSVSALLAENLQLRTRNAELEGEDVAESAASGRVVDATNAVAGLFADPELPDVEPVAPAEDGGTV